MSEPTSEPSATKSSAASHRAESQARPWIAPAALLIAVIAAGLAVWAVLKPPQDQASPASDAQQSADAGDPKARACAAFTTVTAAVKLQTHTDAGAEPGLVQAVAANSRLAMSGGASYLLAQTAPDTPTELAGAIRRFAADLQGISMNALAGVPNEDPAQSARLRDAEELNGKIAALCK